MAFPKTAALIGGFATVGFGSIAVAAWQVNENRTLHDSLTDQNYSGRIIVPSLELHKTQPEHPDIMDYGGSYQCFNHFFPNLRGFVHSFDDQTIEASQHSNSLQVPDPSQVGSKRPMGCALMELSYKYIRREREFKNFVFKSEVTVKNEKLGWSLWAIDEYADNNDGISHLVNYLLVFLENEGGSWKIKGGYKWRDGIIPVRDPYVYISSPDGVWLDASGSKHLPKHSFTKKYAGLWEVDGEGKGEIFREIELRAQRGKGAEILGKADSDFVTSQGKSYGYERLYSNHKEGKWINYMRKEDSDPYISYDASSTINKWYQPFKGKRGNWRSFERYCREESSVKAKSLGKDDPRMKAVLEWCYVKKT